MLSIALLEIYLAFGLQARYVRCLPYDYEDMDCHVVVHVYSEMLKKWVMMDPTFGVYFKNEKEEILSLKEIRESLAKGFKLYINDEANYNGEEIDREDYIAYMAKNVFAFESLKISCYGAENREDNIYVNLDPVGFGGKEKVFKNLEWMFETFKEEFQNNANFNEYMKTKKERILKRTLYNNDDKVFWE